jgi:hypothetical protein
MYSGPSFGADASTIAYSWGYPIGGYQEIGGDDDLKRESRQLFLKEQKVKRQWALILKRKKARKPSTKHKNL